MSSPVRQTLGDYCKRTNSRHISLGFLPVNPETFDIKNYVLSSLKNNPFDKKAIIYPWEHLTKFYQTCSMCKPSGDITDN